MVAATQNHYTRFERARIVGARALQLAMGAPVLIEMPAGLHNPVDVALREFESNVIPITIKRTVPPKQATAGRFYVKKSK